jgi:hypothetical protein
VRRKEEYGSKGNQRKGDRIAKLMKEMKSLMPTDVDGQRFFDEQSRASSEFGG